MQQWLDQHNVSYPPGCTNKVLCKEISDFIKSHEKKYVVDEMLRNEFGIEVLRLPPYHCMLNPIEQLWALRKLCVAKHNRTNKISDVEEHWKASRASIDIESVGNNFRHVRQIEDQFWNIDNNNVVESTSDDTDTMIDVSFYGDAIEELDDEMIHALL